MSSFDFYECERCDGTGEVPKFGWADEDYAEAIDDEWADCPICDGDGEVCSKCDLSHDKCRSYGQCGRYDDELVE
jgi:RecJ-like exonuclease